MINQDTDQVLDLTPYFNNDGISYKSDRTDGDFTGRGNTYAAEDLPPSNSNVTFYGVTFRFPDKRAGLKNNVALEGQHIEVPQGIYKCLYLLGASDGNSLEDSIRFVFANGSQEEAFLGLSSWRLYHNLKYGERAAIKCTGYHFPSQHVCTNRIDVDYGIWMQEVAITTCKVLTAIDFPDNPGMHVFALTLRRAGSDQETQ